MSAGMVTASQIAQIVQQSLQPDLEQIGEMRDVKTGYEDKKLAYNNVDNILESLSSSLKTLTKESSFSSRVATTSNSDLVTASTSSSAAKTSFLFGSIDQLASSAKITSSSSLTLLSGSAPYLLSTADVNGGAVGDYDPNTALNSASQDLSITSGSISINGVSVTINGSDTLYTALSRINNAGAGVVATFDEDNDTIRISGTTIGSDETISFSSGDTNFFEALNLDSSLTAGTDAVKNEAFDDISSGDLSTVSTGYFNINNHTFYVDTATDSLQSIINRVNSSNAGAVMFYDEDTGNVTITNEKTGEPLNLNNDTSGFLAAINVMNASGDQDPGSGASTYLGEKAQFTLNGETIEKDSNNFTIGGVTFTLVGTTSVENPSATISVTTDPDSTVEHINNYVSQFNASMNLLSDTIEQEDGPLERNLVLRRLMTKLRTEALKQISNPGSYSSLADIGFSFEKSGDTFALQIDEDTLRSKLDADETSVRQLFAFNNDSDGLLDDGGYAISVRDLLNNYTRSVSGYFYKQNDKIDEEIDRLELKILNAENRLIDQEKRLFDQTIDSVKALQDLQLQGQKIGQINQIVMSSLNNSASSVFAASGA